MRFFQGLGFGKEYKDGLREGFRTVRECEKVPFRFSHLWNYIYIEFLLIANTFIYGVEFLRRRKFNTKTAA